MQLSARIAGGLALTATLAAGGWSPRNPSTPPSPAVMKQVGELPPALRDRAAAAVAEVDEARRADMVELLMEADAAATLAVVLALLEQDPSPVVRAEIIDELEDIEDPRITPALERRVAADPDPDIVIAALELLRVRATSPLLTMLEGRIKDARAAGDSPQLRRLVTEHERWTTVVRGGLLPTFMQQPPPIFAAAPADARCACWPSATSAMAASRSARSPP